MFFQVDAERCVQDEICIEECPARILVMGEDGPFMVEGGVDICIRCGHCVAVCPTEAVRLEFLGPEQCQVFDESDKADSNQVEKILTSRRSMRTYRQEPLTKEVLQKAIDIASAAPTGSNRQLVEWIVLKKREDVETVADHVINWMRYLIANNPEIASQLNMERIVEGYEQGMDRICRQAPHLVFALTHKDVGVGGADCHTALAYLELILPSLGGGSCWAGYVTFAASQWPPLRQFLDLTEDMVVHGAVMAGVPKYTYPRIPPRNPANISFR